MPRSLAKIVDAQIRKIIKDDNMYYTAVVDPADIHRVYVLIKNLPDHYKDGEYIFRLTIKDNFPDTSPQLEALTPNGTFDIGGLICVSIGEFHESELKVTSRGDAYGWRPTLGLSGFILNSVVNGMLYFTPEDRGIRINIASNDKKKAIADASQKYNKSKYSNICELFDNLFEAHPTLRVWGR